MTEQRTIAPTEDPVCGTSQGRHQASPYRRVAGPAIARGVDGHQKRFNDDYGLQGGDAVLIEAARRIREAVRGWPVYRYAGDHFLVLARVTDEQAQAQLEYTIREAFRRPFIIGTGEAGPKNEVIDVRIMAARATPGSDVTRLRADLDARWAAMQVPPDPRRECV